MTNTIWMKNFFFSRISKWTGIKWYFYIDNVTLRREKENSIIIMTLVFFSPKIKKLKKTVCNSHFDGDYEHYDDKRYCYWYWFICIYSESESVCQMTLNTFSVTYIKWVKWVIKCERMWNKKSDPYDTDVNVWWTLIIIDA